MTPHFTLAEFCRSDVAARKRIDNTLPPELMPAALRTLEMLERIRAHLSGVARRDVPIIISSGYRCPALNRAIGSSSTSDHPWAAAADWTAPSFGTPKAVCDALAPMIGHLGIGQLIYEWAQWIHTSWCQPRHAYNQIITIGQAGTLPGIVQA